MFHVTGAGQANCFLVGWFRGEHPQSRETGPSEQPPCGLRLPLAQPRTPAMPKNYKDTANLVFRPIALLKTSEQPHHEIPHYVDSCIAVAPPRWGFRAASGHRTYPTRDRIFDSASKYQPPPPRRRRRSREGGCRRSPRWWPASAGCPSTFFVFLTTMGKFQ